MAASTDLSNGEVTVEKVAAVACSETAKVEDAPRTLAVVVVALDVGVAVDVEDAVLDAEEEEADPVVTAGKVSIAPILDVLAGSAVAITTVVSSLGVEDGAEPEEVRLWSSSSSSSWRFWTVSVVAMVIAGVA
jgi:hypothetical protein